MSTLNPAALVPGQITRTNIDGTTDTFGGGSAQQSAVATDQMPEQSWESIPIQVLTHYGQTRPA